MEEYILACKKYCGTENESRSAAEDVIFRFYKCMCPSFDPVELNNK